MKPPKKNCSPKWGQNYLFYSNVVERPLKLTCSLLILIVFLKRNWRYVKQTLLKTIIARSPVYFIVLMLISYKHFYFNNLCSVDVSVSVNSYSLPINIFDKIFNVMFFEIALVKLRLIFFHKSTCQGFSQALTDLRLPEIKTQILN